MAGKYDQSKGMARDMNLFVDDDGTGYIIYSSEENATPFISKLNEDYTYLSASPETAVQGVDFLRSETFAGQKREAPAMFKYDGKYYLMTSDAPDGAPIRPALPCQKTGFWETGRSSVIPV